VASYKPTAMVLDIAGHRLFKPVGIKKDEKDKRSFLKLSFANKGNCGHLNLNINYKTRGINIDVYDVICNEYYYKAGIDHAKENM
jgi:hypothetical protein